MNFLLLGAPGSGKGSQAELLEKEYGIIQVSTGDLLRDAVSNNTEIGIKAKVKMEKGELVRNECVLEILEERIKQHDCDNGIIFDGFPRNIEQTKLLEDLLEKRGKKLNLVINIQVPFEVIIARLNSRRVCRDCGKGYNMISNPPKENRCESCSGAITIREDDKEEVVRHRLDVYNENTKPLIEHYSKKGIMININGVGNIADIYKELTKYIKEKKVQ
ncbi:MAG: adenylate kinase [Candidatus Delongbacteria bacterium]|jgi:adenylate kinase|nr:adenylate kinase [Candidatus Delongbacteria bacterium]